jgi:hypothetical protein
MAPSCAVPQNPTTPSSRSDSHTSLPISLTPFPLPLSNGTAATTFPLPAHQSNGTAAFRFASSYLMFAESLGPAPLRFHV